MESTAKFILESHFGRLKQVVNDQLSEQKRGMEDELVEALKTSFHYLKKLEYKGVLDAEGVKVYEKITSLLDDLYAASDVAVPEKLPMAKAGNRKAEKRTDEKKTGS